MMVNHFRNCKGCEEWLTHLLLGEDDLGDYPYLGAVFQAAFPERNISSIMEKEDRSS